MNHGHGAALASLALTVVAAGCNPGPLPPPASYRAIVTGDTIMAPVVHVSDAVSLGNGVWAVLGIEEAKVLEADFGTDTIHPYPGISHDVVPGAAELFSVGDTIFVADWALHRVTEWDSSGNRLDAIPTPEALSGAFPRARDAAGQWYFEVPPPRGPDGQGVKDSSAVVRSDPLMSRFDTLVMLAPPDLATVNRTGEPRLEPRLLSGRDRWGVEPDGTLWLARVNQNQVFWYSASGKEIAHSRRLPDQILPITEMDRQIALRRYPEDNRPNQSMVSFALIKPPFEQAFGTADGVVWLYTSAPALDSVRTFKVVDTTGWFASVEVPSYGTALGVSGDELLMGEENPAGIRLLRFKLPLDSIKARRRAIN